MKGYVKHGEVLQRETPEHLEDWEGQVIDAIGNLIEFWGFKRNQGRLWALLYLRDEAMTATHLMEALELSKGSVSTITRDLEHWGVLHRIRVSGRSAWHFRAETDLLRMIGHVLEEREAKVITKVREQLDEAIEAARESGWAFDAELERLQQMRLLASITENALGVMLYASRWSMDGLQGMLSRLQKWIKKD